MVAELAETQGPADGRVDQDSFVYFRNASWSDYQRMMELRHGGSVPRMAYLEGFVELMSPSRAHETLKSTIGRLIEAWCLHHDIDFGIFGSWTLENKELERGVEPDECYCFGGVEEPTRPDLAIEVIWTSGGLDKREIYQALGVPELWFWQDNQFSIFVLEGAHYVEHQKSRVLPGIGLGVLAQYLCEPVASRAIKAYRASLCGDSES